MSKMWIIAKNEYDQVVRKKSFIIGLVLTPIIMAGFVFIPSLMADKKAKETEAMVVADLSGSGIGRDIVTRLSEYTLDDSVTAYYKISLMEADPENAAASSAAIDTVNQRVSSDEVKYGIIVTSNELNDSSVYVVTNSDDFTSLERFEDVVSNVMAARRLRQANVELPVDSILGLTQHLSLSVRNTRGEEVSLQTKYFAMIVFVMMIYAMILGYGMQVMRSVIEEKTTRIMEVLISSVTPFQLMLGKILGLGAATFTSVLVWIAMGAVFYLSAGAAGMALDPSVTSIAFNPVIVIAFTLFLVSGYLLYSTIYAVIGSIVTSEKEAQNFHYPIILALIMPIFIGTRVMQEPNNTTAMILSFVPFLTPTLMMMRVSFIAPTLDGFSLTSGIMIQVFLGFAVVVLTTIAITWLAARIFRVGVLMYGKRPTLAEVVKWVKY